MKLTKTALVGAIGAAAMLGVLGAPLAGAEPVGEATAPVTQPGTDTPAPAPEQPGTTTPSAPVEQPGTTAPAEPAPAPVEQPGTTPAEPTPQQPGTQAPSDPTSEQPGTTTPSAPAEQPGTTTPAEPAPVEAEAPVSQSGTTTPAEPAPAPVEVEAPARPGTAPAPSNDGGQVPSVPAEQPSSPVAGGGQAPAEPAASAEQPVAAAPAPEPVDEPADDAVPAEPVDPALTAAVTAESGDGAVAADMTVSRSGAVAPGTLEVTNAAGERVVSVDAAAKTVAVGDREALKVEAPAEVKETVATVSSARAAFDAEVNRVVRGLVDDRVEAVADSTAAAVGQAQTGAREVVYDSVASEVPVSATQSAGGATVTVDIDEAQ